MKSAILLGIGLILTSGCEGLSTDANSSTAAALTAELAVQAPAKPPTPEEWRAAFEGTFKAGSIRDLGDGVTEFTACFNNKEENDCGNFSFASRDAFRKVWHFTPGLRSETAVDTYLISYISVRENKSPKILLAPKLFSKDGWLFMNHVAIMIDGELEIEQDFDSSDVKREIFPGGVEERADFIASEAQIAALRKITEDSKVIIRITGDKGYISVQQDDIDSIKDEVRNLLEIYDSILIATKDKLIPEEIGGSPE